jgi:peptidoglycan/LPS O-acetylase OafA/YrhL
LKRIPQIDGLRAIAILLVITFHYVNNQLVNSASTAGVFFYRLTSFGWIGVDLFFVISGFLIGSILLLNRKSPKLYKTFYIRRFVRIVPNYYLLIVLFLVIQSSPYFRNDYFVSGNNVIPSWSYFLMIHNFFMARLQNMGNDALSVTWSIGIEEQFYLIFPLIILTIKEKYLPILLVLLIISANYFRSLYAHWIPAYVLLPCRMDSISFGILIAWLYTNYDMEQFVQRHKIKLTGIIAIVAIGCLYLFYEYQDLGFIRNTLFALVFACSIVLAIGTPNSFYSRILSHKILYHIGKISYSLYLFHYLILGIFNHFGNEFLNKKDTFTRILLTMTALLFALFFSWMVYHFLEKKAVAIGKKFSYS